MSLKHLRQKCISVSDVSRRLVILSEAANAREKTGSTLPYGTAGTHRHHPWLNSILHPALRRRFGLSFRNLEELMVERNVTVDHVTIWRWVQRYAPELDRRCRS